MATKQIELKKFLAFFDGIDFQDFDMETVGAFMAENTPSVHSIAPYTHFSNDHYMRNLIYRSEHYELILLTWNREQRSPIHDHGGSRCWVQVIAGEITVKNYFVPEIWDGPVTLKPQGPVQKLGISSSVYVDDDTAIHCITNAAIEPAISLHLYAKPVDRCRIYDESLRSFSCVDLGYDTVIYLQEREVAQRLED